MAGWLVGLDPIAASTLFVAALAIVCLGLDLPHGAQGFAVGAAVATVANPASDLLYYGAGTIVQCVLAWGWAVEVRRHRRWLSRSMALTAGVVCWSMLAVWVGARIIQIVPVEPGIAEGWSQVMGWPHLTLYVATGLILAEVAWALRWIERSV